MRLLICTQKVDKNDDVLGFFHDWVGEFARQATAVTVLALEVGAYDLPANVRVFSLGKEKRPSRLLYIFNFYRIIWRERKNYDAVFVHMNPEYVVLGGILWKALGKRIALWYTHKSVNTTLRLAAHGADAVFTASPESFRLPTKKLHIMGHGIDAARWGALPRHRDDKFYILTIGRLSRTKGYTTFLEALKLLKESGKIFEALIVGGPVTPDDERYVSELTEEIRRRGLWGIVYSVGAVAHHDIGQYLAKADLFVNMSATGSLDKAVLEAMAAKIPVLTSNEGLATVPAKQKDTCMFTPGDAKEFAAKMTTLMDMSDAERTQLGEELRAIVTQDHALPALIKRILARLQPTE